MIDERATLLEVIRHMGGVGQVTKVEYPLEGEIEGLTYIVHHETLSEFQHAPPDVDRVIDGVRVRIQHQWRPTHA